MRVRYDYSSRMTRRIDPHNRHRIAVPTIVKDIVRISDVVLEIIDSRFIDESRNMEMEELVKNSGKTLVYVLNKVDLVDMKKLKEEIEKRKLFPFVILSSKSGIGKGKLIERIKIESKRGLKEKKFEIAHVGVIGYPNTGKSSLINFLTGRGSARTSAEPGYTKGMQKIKLARGILLLDTPGVIPEKENSNINKDDLVKHSKIFVRKHDKVKDPGYIVAKLIEEKPELFEGYYKIKIDGNVEKFIEEVGRKRAFVLRGNVIDFNKAARSILKDWQIGIIKVK